MGNEIAQQRGTGLRLTSSDLAAPVAGKGGRRPLLTAYQTRLVRQVWSHMSKTGSSNVGRMIYDRMIQRDADIRRIMLQITSCSNVSSGASKNENRSLTPLAARQHHSAYIVNLLDQSLQLVTEPARLEEMCWSVGRRHAQFAEDYGLRAEYWDKFGEAVTEAAREWQGWRTHREALRALNQLVSFVVDRLRMGFQDGLRERKRAIEQAAVSENVVNSSYDTSYDTAPAMGRSLVASSSGAAQSRTPVPVPRRSSHNVYGMDMRKRNSNDEAAVLSRNVSPVSVAEMMLMSSSLPSSVAAPFDVVNMFAQHQQQQVHQRYGTIPMREGRSPAPPHRQQSAGMMLQRDATRGQTNEGAQAQPQQQTPEHVSRRHRAYSAHQRPTLAHPKWMSSGSLLAALNRK